MAFYDAIPASDGTTLTAPMNAEFKVFEVYDTARANPLPLRSAAGLDAAPLVTTAQGVVPPVEVVSPNFEHIFQSGEWEWRRESSEGMRKAVEESRVAAEEAAQNAGAPTDAMVDQGIQRANLPNVISGMVAERFAQLPIQEVLGQYELQQYVNMGDSWSDPARVNITTGASPSERLGKRLSTAAITHRGFSSRTVEDLANISLGGANGWAPRTKALVTITSCHLNDTKYLGTGPAAERGYKHAWRALLSTLTADTAVASNTTAFAYSPGWAAETTTGSTAQQAANNSTGGRRYRTTTAGAYALINVTGTAVDIFAVARKAGAGLMTVTDNASGATLGSLDLTGTVAQETPAVLKLRSLGSGTHTLKITHTSGASLTLDSVRIPTANPTPIVLVPAPDVQNGGGNTLPSGDPSPSYNAAQATARRWMSEIAADYPSVTVCDLNNYGFDKVADFYTDLRHLNDRGAAKWAAAVLDHIKGRGYTQGLNTIGNDPASYTPPAPPEVPSGGQNGTGGDGKPEPKVFTDSSHEWLFSKLSDGPVMSLRDSVAGTVLAASDDSSAPRAVTEGELRFLRFRGTTANPDFLSNLDEPRPAVETVAILFRFGAVTANRRYLMASGNIAENPQAVMGVLSDLSSFVMHEGTPLTLAPAVAPDVGWHVGVFVRNGTSSVIRVDAAEGVGNSGSSTTKTGFRIARDTLNDPNKSTPVDVGAIVTFDYAATAAQRQAIVAKLAALRS